MPRHRRSKTNQTSSLPPVLEQALVQDVTIDGSDDQDDWLEFLSPGIPKAIFQQAVQSYRNGELHAFHQNLATASFRKSKVSVTLADPDHPDCPLIACSQGFEEMTGYTEAEIIGNNCRFLSRGCRMPLEVRHQMRICVRVGKKFIGVIENRKKDGRKFQNLLHMTSIRIGDSCYRIGIQADVTDCGIDVDGHHMKEIEDVAKAIFSANVDAWATIQFVKYKTTKMTLKSTSIFLQELFGERRYLEAQNAFVGIDEATTNGKLVCKNTFLERKDQEDTDFLMERLQRSASAPTMVTSGFRPLDSLDECVFSWGRTFTAPVRQKMLASTNLQSVGSKLHPELCTPCAFFCYSLKGCNRGESCAYCHMPHIKTRRKPRRGTRLDKSKKIEDSPPTLEKRATASNTTRAASPDGSDSSGSEDFDDKLSITSGDVTSFSNRGPLCVADFLKGGVSGHEVGNMLFPMPLVLLDALERLAPLPAPPGLCNMPLQYSGSTLVLSDTPTKLVPFVSDLVGPFKFSTTPMLPTGVLLDITSGVIRSVGDIYKHHLSDKTSLHTVTLEASNGSAETQILLVAN